MSLRHRRLIALLVILVVAAMPEMALASGRTVYAPPGKAGASEYFEDVPSPGGGTTPPANLSTPSPKNLNHLGKGGSAARKLKKLGTTGTAAANWAQASAPAIRRTSLAPSGTTPSAHVASLHVGSGISAIGDVLDGNDSGGLGAVLPLLLGLSLAGAVGFAVGRRVRRRGPA